MSDRFQECRRDSTSTCSVVRSEAGWSVATVGSHATEHIRSWDPAGSLWNAEQKTLDPASRDRSARVLSWLYQELRLLDDLPWPAATTVQVTLTQGHREYHNSEGIDASIGITQWEVSLTHHCGASLRRVASHSNELRAVGHYLVANRPGPTPDGQGSRSVLGSGADLPLVLAPEVAGILIHELVGHAMEEGDLWPGEQLLPPGTDVVADVPPSRDLDDEGIVTAPQVLVANGRVSRRMRDRMGCLVDGARPAGHAWASPHSAIPRLRLPNLRLEVSSRAGRETVPGRFLRCQAVRGARYFRGQALLDVIAAEPGSRPGSAATHQCRLAARLQDLTDLTVLTKGNHLEPSPAGMCIKNGEPLPSKTVAPELLFPCSSRLLLRT